jgi:soluble lytic murein transglycosylase
MPFRDTVLARAGIGLDPAYVYGLIRQESRFIMDARSGVGASGLMQVMPATARWTAKKIGMTASRPTDQRPRHQHHHRHRLPQAGAGRLRGLHALAAAAYNAGPAARATGATARCWTPPSGPRTCPSAKRATT